MCRLESDDEKIEKMRKENPDEVRRLAQASIAKEVEAMLAFKERGAVVFDNGNNIRSQADEHGVKNAFSIDIFTARYLRPLFCQRNRSFSLDRSFRRCG